MMNKVLSCLLMALFTVLSINAQETQPNDEINVVKVRDSIYMLQGRGGNIGVSIGEDGIFMIDDKFASSTPNILIYIEISSHFLTAVVCLLHHQYCRKSI